MSWKRMRLLLTDEVVVPVWIDWQAHSLQHLLRFSICKNSPVCFSYWYSFCEAWLTWYVRLKGEWVRSRRVVMLIEIRMLENPLISLSLLPIEYQNSLFRALLLTYLLIDIFTGHPIPRTYEFTLFRSFSSILRVFWVRWPSFREWKIQPNRYLPSFVEPESLTYACPLRNA